jgi:hypothetical protein
VQIDSLSWREGAMAEAVVEKVRALGLRIVETIRDYFEY